MNHFEFLLKEYNTLETVYELFEYHGLTRVSNHTRRVVDYAMKLGKQHGLCEEKCKTAALLHDISGIVLNEHRIKFCDDNKIKLLKEEMMFPMLSHQKVSKKLAEDIYKVYDQDVLNAIGCHTTLISNPSKLDLIVFISDKIEWDQDGEPAYKLEMIRKLDDSLEACALYYIDFVLKEGKLKVPHPWFLEAKVYLTDYLLSQRRANVT